MQPNVLTLELCNIIRFKAQSFIILNSDLNPRDNIKKKGNNTNFNSIFLVLQYLKSS